jgi:hypothetical protein
VASAGGKISFALEEVQPGATLFAHEIFAAEAEKFLRSTESASLWCICF